MTKLQKAAQGAIKRQGTIRAAAKVLKVSPSYLHRIANGERTNVSLEVMKRLGFDLVVSA